MASELRQNAVMSVLRVRLTGPDATLGRVPARDVANLIIEVERAVTRAAAAVANQPKKTRGRYKGTIEQAGRFRLRALEEGSVVPVLELPEQIPTDDQQSLDISTPSLTELALKELMDSAEGHKSGLRPVADALWDFTEAVRVGDRYDGVSFNLRSANRQERTVTIDRSVRERLRPPDAEPSVREDVLTGILFEADFEKQTAQLRTPQGAAIGVAFSDELADGIQSALRERAGFEGDVVYDTDTMTVRSIRLREIVRGTQLSFGVDERAFWQEPSFADLADAQSSAGEIAAASLHHQGASDQELDAFLAALNDASS